MTEDIKHPVVFTRHGVARGIRTALPLVIGTFPFGLVVGVISDQKGLSWLETLLMSALVFAGSSQLLALELWSEPAPILAAIIAAIVVNIRMAPMGAALAPWLDKLRGVKLWGSMAFMVDHAFALSAAEQRRGGRDAGYLLGIGVTLWCFWNISVTLGHIFGFTVRSPLGIPLYLAVTPTFVVILVPPWRGVPPYVWPLPFAGLLPLLAWKVWLGPLRPLLHGRFRGCPAGLRLGRCCE